MHAKREPVVTEEPKHKKKSTSKGQPRSKHKHTYETVLLTRYHHFTDCKTGKPIVHENTRPTKVCTICGRIDMVDKDESYYVKESISGLPFIAHREELSEKALSLPKWYVEEYWDKFAIKMDDEVDS